MEYVCISETMQLKGSYVEDLLCRQQLIFSWTGFERTSSFTMVQLSRVPNEGWGWRFVKKGDSGGKRTGSPRVLKNATLHKNKEFIKSNCSLS